MPSAQVRSDGGNDLLDKLGITDQLESASAEVSARLQSAVASMRGSETTAKYKLEIYPAAGGRRNAMKGAVVAWSNAGSYHGGGDSGIYFCPSEIEGQRSLCLSPIDLSLHASNGAVCSSCHRHTESSALIGQIIIEQPLQRWAEILTKLFYHLECNADIRMFVEAGSIRQAAAAETTKYAAGEVYATLYGKRQWIVYSLESIIADTSTGARLEQRIRAFLGA